MLGLGLEDQTQVTVQGVLVDSLVRPLAIELVNSSVGSVFFGRRLDPFLREFVCVVEVLGEVK